jgi:hypothetical protein
MHVTPWFTLYTGKDAEETRGVEICFAKGIMTSQENMECRVLQKAAAVLASGVSWPNLPALVPPIEHDLGDHRIVRYHHGHVTEQGLQVSQP